MIEFKWQGDKVLKEVQKAKKVALLAGGNALQGYAASLAPVDTGNLRSSITVGPVQSDYIDIYTDVEYAIYQEFGTSRGRGRKPARPFMRPALDNNHARLQQLMGQVISDALKR